MRIQNIELTIELAGVGTLQIGATQSECGGHAFRVSLHKLSDALQRIEVRDGNVLIQSEQVALHELAQLIDRYLEGIDHALDQHPLYGIGLWAARQPINFGGTK